MKRITLLLVLPFYYFSVFSQTAYQLGRIDRYIWEDEDQLQTVEETGLATKNWTICCEI